MGVSTIIVIMEGGKKVRITVPDGGRVLFDFVTLPEAILTKIKPGYELRPYFRALQIFDKEDKLLASIPQATSFRYTDVNFTEEVVKEEGSAIWSSDQNGYERTEKARRTEMFEADEATRRLTQAREEGKRPRK